MNFQHVTARKHLEFIAAEGLRSGCYLTSEDRHEISDYYAETIEDEGEEPVIITVQSAGVRAEDLLPDFNGIWEPLTYTLGMTEKQVIKAWESTGKTWSDSVELIGTCRCMAAIPPEHLLIDGRPITECVAPVPGEDEASEERVRG